MFTRSVSPELAPERPTYVEVGFERGDAVSVDGEPLSPANLLRRLNDLAGANGIGRLDLVENRYVGMKSRGVYETPGGTVLLAAHRGIESITLDRGAAHLKDELMPRYAELIYNGYWFSPERQMLQAAIDQSQEHVTGTVRLKLFKGSVTVVGRKSPVSLYSEDYATFEADTVYDQKDAEGFIKLNALRLRVAGRNRSSSIFSMLNRLIAVRPTGGAARAHPRASCRRRYGISPAGSAARIRLRNRSAHRGNHPVPAGHHARDCRW
jgi:argininosuccinate synthase